MDLANRRLMWHGMFLFLLGLVTGFAEQHFANMRMGLAAHLEGVMNGIFLLSLGGAWSYVKLPGSMKTVGYWIALYCTYVNWFMTMLAAVFGTGALSPITAPGYKGATLAGELDQYRIHVRWDCDHIVRASGSVGTSRKCFGGVEAISERGLRSQLRGRLASIRFLFLLNFRTSTTVLTDPSQLALVQG